MSGHPDDAVDEMYYLYEEQPNGEKRCVFSSSSLPYVRLQMRVLCDAYTKNNLDAPTYSIEAD